MRTKQRLLFILSLLSIIGISLNTLFAPTIHAQSPSCTDQIFNIKTDGVGFQICTQFLSPSSFVVSNSDGTELITSLTDREDGFRELSIIAIPYGMQVGTEDLPTAQEGGAEDFKSALQVRRSRQGAVAIATPTITIFGDAVKGYASSMPILVGAAEKQIALISEWVIERGQRIWIIRATKQITQATDTQTVLERATATVITSINPDIPSPNANSAKNSQPPQSNRPSSPISPNDYPSPVWWNGDCDLVNYRNATGKNSYPLGGSYLGIKACGPRPNWDSGAPNPGPIVRFFAGAWGEYEWQCVELVMRYLYIAYRINPYGANGSQVVANYSGSVLHKVSNGTSGKYPRPGDVVSYESTSTFGHTDIVVSSSVDANGNGTFTTLNQNYGGTSTTALQGYRTMNVRNWVAGNANGWLTTGTQNTAPTGYLDAPTPNQTLSGTTQVRGWAKVTGSTMDRIEVFIDGQVRAYAEYGQPRPDAGGNFGFSWNWDTTQLSNGTHSLQVKAVAANGTSTALPTSSGGNVTTFNVNIFNNRPPTIPNLLNPADNASINNRLVTLAWQATSDDGLPHNNHRDYQIELSKQDDSWSNTHGWITETSWATAVPSDGQYRWRVRSGDGATASDWAQPWNFLVDTVPPVVQIQALAATQTTSSIVLNWSGSDALTAIGGYEAEYRMNGGAWQMLGIRANDVSFTFTGAVDMATYQFRIRAHDEVGNYSNWVESNTTQVQLNTPDNYENDNTTSAASILDTPQVHNFHVAGDHDWVKFYLPAYSPMTLITTNLGDKADTIIELYDTSFNLIGSSDDWDDSRASRVDVKRSISGLVYARIRHYSADMYGTGTGYTLILGAGDGLEHDNTVDTAFNVSPFYQLTPSTSHTTHVPKDEDWIAFDTTGVYPMTLMTFDLGASSDTVLDVITDAGIVTNDDYQDGSLASRVDFMANAGTMKAKVRQYSAGAYGDNTSYRLLLAQGDNFEPDNSPETAKPLIPNSAPAIHTTHVLNDLDYHVVDLVEGQRYAFYLQLQGSAADVMLKLFPEGQPDHILAENNNYNPMLSVVAPTTGRYLLQITPYNARTYGDANETGYTVIARQDSQIPSGSITANITMTKSLTVPVQLAASDGVDGSGVYQMEFAVYSEAAGYWLWSGWKPFAPTYDYRFSDEDGIRTLFVHYKDRAGNISEWSNVTIYLDRQPPTISSFEVSPPPGQLNEILLNWSAYDSVTEIKEVGINWRVANGQWYLHTFNDPTTTSAIFYGSPGSTYEFGVYVEDLLGNSSLSPVRTGSSPACTGDSYEPNGSTSNAKVQQFGTISQHNFCQQDDNDWIRISAQARHEYVFETLNLNYADTVLRLYATDGTTMLAMNDDSTVNNEHTLASRITWNAPSSGTYYIKVTNFQNLRAGNDLTYSFRLTDNGITTSFVYIPLVTSGSSSVATKPTDAEAISKYEPSGTDTAFISAIATSSETPIIDRSFAMGMLTKPPINTLDQTFEQGQRFVRQPVQSQRVYPHDKTVVIHTLQKLQK